MQTVIRRIAVVAGLALIAGTAGCSADSLTGATVAAPSALFDGGATFGSGSAVGMPGMGNRTATDSGSVARGGATFGSGS